jgi:hypothetical protein
VRGRRPGQLDRYDGQQWGRRFEDRQGFWIQFRVPCRGQQSEHFRFPLRMCWGRQYAAQRCWCHLSWGSLGSGFHCWKVHRRRGGRRVFEPVRFRSQLVPGCALCYPRVSREDWVGQQRYSSHHQCDQAVFGCARMDPERSEFYPRGPGGCRRFGALGRSFPPESLRPARGGRGRGSEPECYRKKSGAGQ